MDSVGYQDFVKRAKNGEILIGIEPAIARKLFTETNHAVIRQEISESLFIERFFVTVFQFLQWITLLAGVIISIFALKWYSAIPIPLMIVGAFVFGGKASMGIQKVGGAILLVVISIVLAYYFRHKGIAMVAWLLSLPLPYFFARLTYKLATVFLRMLSLRNEKAFNLLYGDAIFLKEM